MLFFFMIKLLRFPYGFLFSPAKTTVASVAVGGGQVGCGGLSRNCLMLLLWFVLPFFDMPPIPFLYSIIGSYFSGQLALMIIS